MPPSVKASPHTRGWTRSGGRAVLRWGGFPAHAGMDPLRRSGAGGRLPRTRGDGPCSGSCRKNRRGASPHTRGWTRDNLRDPASPHTRGWTLVSSHRILPVSGFPAHAGMDPPRPRRRRHRPGLPRTRGDGPWWKTVDDQSDVASPHTRGWTRGMGVAGARGRGFPAHAGMDPPRRCPGRRRPWLPRTRGDGPRGATTLDVASRASPHTRGWTGFPVACATCTGGFPAHAGMDPGQPWRSGSRSWLPRTRGDGPDTQDATIGVFTASPHTRGWTQVESYGMAVGRGFPAHAGMDPRPCSARARTHGLPRTRGDGPRRVPAPRLAVRASPHTRGWTRGRVGSPCSEEGFPAHAGMDP